MNKIIHFISGFLSRSSHRASAVFWWMYRVCWRMVVYILYCWMGRRMWLTRTPLDNLVMAWPLTSSPPQNHSASALHFVYKMEINGTEKSRWLPSLDFLIFYVYDISFFKIFLCFFFKVYTSDPPQIGN